MGLSRQEDEKVGIFIAVSQLRVNLWQVKDISVVLYKVK